MAAAAAPAAAAAATAAGGGSKFDADVGRGSESDTEIGVGSEGESRGSVGSGECGNGSCSGRSANRQRQRLFAQNLKCPSPIHYQDLNHKPSAKVIMDIHFGPKVPNRVIRIRAGAKVLQIASDSIRDAVWEPVEDIHDDRFFDFSDLKIIPYHSECGLVAGASYYAVYKQPNQCRYVVLWEDSTDFGAFTLQGGSNSSLQSATSLTVCLAKHCFIVFKKVKRLAINDYCQVAKYQILSLESVVNTTGVP